jgi:hypothetical protein
MKIKSSMVLLRIGVYTVAIVFGIFIGMLMILNGFSERSAQIAASIWVFLCWLYTVRYLPMEGRSK